MKDGKFVKVNYLMEVTGEDEELVREILQLFVDETRKELDNLNIAVQERRCKDVAKIAHKMKSSMLSLGLQGMADELIDIESQIHAKGMCEDTEANALRIFSTCQQVFEEVQAMLSNQE